MANNPIVTATYAYGIYIYGNRTFSTINQDYVSDVMQYAADHFTLAQIQNALAQGWITQQEYDDTIALM